MKVGDLVCYVNGDGSTGIVLARWVEGEPGIGILETWYEVLWSDGAIECALVSRWQSLEKVA